MVDRETAMIDAQLNSMQRLERDLAGVSTQGAHAVGHFKDATLRKATVEQYGESYKASSRFYFSTSRELIFVAETEERYDRPFDVPGAQVNQRIERVYYYETGHAPLVREDGRDVDAMRSERLGASTSSFAKVLSRQLMADYIQANPSFQSRITTFTYDGAGNVLMLPSSAAAPSGSK